MAGHRTTITNLPAELIAAVIRNILPRQGNLYDYDINDLSSLASFRAAYPQFSGAVDCEWRLFHGSGQNRVRLCATIINMNFQPLVRFLDQIGPVNTASVYRLLLAFENFPPLGEASLPESFWLLIRHKFYYPISEPRDHFRGDWDSRWRVGYWAEKFQEAVQLAQRASQAGISEAEFRGRYRKWRARAVLELQRTEQNL